MPELSEKLTEYVSYLSKNLESLSYVNTFNNYYIDGVDFHFDRLKKLTIGVLIEFHPLDNWLVNAPQLEELYVYCFWPSVPGNGEQIYVDAIEKLVQEHSKFFLKISYIHYRYTSLVYGVIGYNLITQSVAKISDFDDLLPEAESYEVNEYGLENGQLKWLKCYSRREIRGIINIIYHHGAGRLDLPG